MKTNPCATRWPAIVAALLLTSPAAASAQRFTVLLVGNPAGEQVVAARADGTLSAAFRYDDRGRGPATTTTWRLDSAGLPLAVTVEGVDYMKAPVQESFTVAGKLARWRSVADSGSAGVGGYYLTLDGPPADVGLLASALLADEDQSLALLPTGQARLERIERVELAGRQLVHVEIHGLDFAPTPLWLNEDGSLFAQVSGWISVIEQGHEAQVPVLLARQEAREDAWFASMADRARTTPTNRVLLENARIVDVRRGTVRKEAAVLIEGGRIAALLDRGDERPADVTVVDAGGRTMLPGLWDMHTHLSLANGPLHIAAGVTTVRDLGNDHDQLARIIERFDSGAIVGPRVFRAGIIDGTGPYAGPTPARVADASQAREWVDFYADRAYSQIKIYSSVPPPLVPVIVERARERALKVSGHVPAGMWAEDAVRAGFDEIQHLNMLFLNFYRDVTETRTPDRFIKVAKRGAELDLESAGFRAFVELLHSRHTVIDPTVSTFFDLFVHRPGAPQPSLAAIHHRLPARLARSSLKGGLAVAEGQEARYAAAAQRMLDVIRALHASGVTLVAGTDAMPGFALHTELEHYVRAGIAPAEVLRIATLGAAEVVGAADEVGAIEPGLRADLVLVDGEPDRQISDIRKVSWVMKAGVMYDPATIHEAIGVTP